jgi:hypothetical protein
VLRLAGGAICGIAAGMVTGIAARAAMRMVADGVPDPIRSLPMFTAEGTATIIGIAALVGAPFGVLFAAVYDALPGPRLSRGFLFGLAMLVTLGPLFFTGARDEFITYERMVLFAFLFPVFGLAAGLVFEPSRRLARRLPDLAQPLLALIAIGGGVLVGTGIFGFAVEAAQTHGTLAVAYAVPWLALALLGWIAHSSARVSDSRV